MSAIVVAVLSAVGFLGASLLALAGKGLGDRTRALAIAVAAGILLALAFGDLFPEALEHADGAAIWGFSGGFALLLVAEVVTRGHTHHVPHDHVGRHPLTPFVIGLAIHNVADGFVLGISGELSSTAALAVGVGVLLHQVPVGMSLAAVFLSDGVSRREALRVAVPLALAIPAATIATTLLPSPSDLVLGLLVGAAGGALTYMSASHLLPEMQSEEHNRLPAAAFVATLALVATLLTVLHH